MLHKSIVWFKDFSWAQPESCVKVQWTESFFWPRSIQEANWLSHVLSFLQNFFFFFGGDIHWVTAISVKSYVPLWMEPELCLFSPHHIPFHPYVCRVCRSFTRGFLFPCYSYIACAPGVNNFGDNFHLTTCEGIQNWPQAGLVNVKSHKIVMSSCLSE